MKIRELEFNEDGSCGSAELNRIAIAAGYRSARHLLESEGKWDWEVSEYCRRLVTMNPRLAKAAQVEDAADPEP
jgi:hypothetical protein